MTQPKENLPVYPVPAPLPPPTSTASSRLVTVHAVNWHNVLDFTQIFRGFRLAINPAKLTVALLAIMLIYCAGRALDAVWGPQVYSGEIDQFGQLPYDRFFNQRDNANTQRTDSLKNLLDAALPDKSHAQELSEDPAAAFRALRSAYELQFHQAVDDIHTIRQRAEAASNPSVTITGDTKTPAEIEQIARAAAAAELLKKVQAAHEAAGHGIFDSFLQFEIGQFDQLVENTLTFVRISPVRSGTDLGGTGDGQAVSGGLLSKDPDRLWRSDTVAGCIANMTIIAPRWLFTGTAPMQWRPKNVDTWAGWIHMVAYRGLYLVSLGAFTLFSLVMLAFAGASIARLSALELAGVERAPLKDVFAFAWSRLWVFMKAPVAPFVILLVIGCAMSLGGLLGAIPLVGPLIVGALFFLFLAVSFVLMLLLLGILGGFNLLYPTVAVEGSDAFDAMSRAFAYVYARPWRLFFYTVTALIYGVFTFLFFSFAVYLLLILTHTFVGWGTNFFGTHFGAYSGLPAMETLWPSPHFARLVSPINWYVMSWPEYLGALFLHFWVFILITSIGAYVMSYYFSCHTIIYLLLRRSVDGQDVHEVYTEPAAGEPAQLPEAVPPPTSVAEVPTVPTPPPAPLHPPTPPQNPGPV